jgi:hypothetical protein
MIAALVLATLAAAPGRPPQAGVEPAHAPAETALLRAAYPDYDATSGWLGHGEGVLVGRSSACQETGLCFLAVAASDGRAGAESGGHAWTTFFAFRPVSGGWVEEGTAAGPVISAVGRWLIGVSVLIDGDGPFVLIAAATGGGEDGEGTATHLWAWAGKKFLPVLTAANTRQGKLELEASFVLCIDRPEDRPSWELRSKEREGRGKWTETRTRVLWNGQAWVERPADKACLERTGAAAVASAPAASSLKITSAAVASTLKVKSASASKTAAGPKGQPNATAPSNAIDGNSQTAWVAGGKGGGVGEWLQVDLATPSVLGSVQLIATCPGADWKASPRVKKLRLRFEDGPAQEETLADVQSSQSIIVKRKAPARWLRVELVELYRGSKKQEACLTEVTPQAR